MADGLLLSMAFSSECAYEGVFILTFSSSKPLPYTPLTFAWVVNASGSMPYLVAGVMPAFDVGKKRSDFLKLSSNDFFISVGF